MCKPCIQRTNYIKSLLFSIPPDVLREIMRNKVDKKRALLAASVAMLESRLRGGESISVRTMAEYGMARPHWQKAISLMVELGITEAHNGWVEKSRVIMSKDDAAATIKNWLMRENES